MKSKSTGNKTRTISLVDSMSNPKDGMVRAIVDILNKEIETLIEIMIAKKKARKA